MQICAAGDGRDAFRARSNAPGPGQHFVLRPAAKRPKQYRREQFRRLQALVGPVRRPRAGRRVFDGRWLVREEEHRHRSQSHDAAIACRRRIRRSRERIPGVAEPRERPCGGRPDIEAGARAAHVTFRPAVAEHLVARIEASQFNQARRAAQCHRRVVDPMARRQFEGTAAGLSFTGWNVRAAWTRQPRPARRRRLARAGNRGTARGDPFGGWDPFVAIS